jgi:hypothetical protein
MLQGQDVLRFSWPFTVYAVVNCLLIFWYDISSPVQRDKSRQIKARQNYAAVVKLLKEMGVTWWAAAAKHKLAEALAKAASELSARESKSSPNSVTEVSDTLPEKPQTSNQVYQYQHPPTPHSGGNLNDIDLEVWSDDNLFSGTNNADYWASIGLDFDADVAGNVFSLFQSDELFRTNNGLNFQG